MDKIYKIIVRSSGNFLSVSDEDLIHMHHKTSSEDKNTIKFTYLFAVTTLVSMGFAYIWRELFVISIFLFVVSMIANVVILARFVKTDSNRRHIDHELRRRGVNF